MKYARYSNVFTSKTGDYLVRAVDVPTVSHEDFCKAVGELGQGLSAEQMELAFKLAMTKLKDFIGMGATVHLNIAEFRLGVKGTIDPAGTGKSVKGALQCRAGQELTKEAEGLSLTEVQPGAAGPVLFSVQDIATEEVNTGLSPGGMAALHGHRIKIENGCVKLRNADTGEVTEVTGNLGENNPSKVLFLVPASLPAGTYRLSLETCYNSNAKFPYSTPRVAELDADLSIPPLPQSGA